MKKACVLLAAAALVISLSGSVHTWGLDYELRGLSPGERMAVLDTTTIGEKWVAVRLVMIGLGLSLIAGAGVLGYRSRHKILAR
ncbi:MAG: hypothetical protein QOG71_1043 [Pyrinomonadaceae bacterium]|nr:hypothetical protein [Pyrinomonadaceae bacterium]